MNNDTTYLKQLASALGRRGLDSARTAEVIEEVNDHLEESGESGQEAFGKPDEYAATLTESGQPAATNPQEGFEVRTFRATAFDEMEILSDLGHEGWELIGVRDFGLHARRAEDPSARAKWEYERRQTLRPGPMREGMEAAGWTQCGQWVIFHYFKRLTSSAP